MYDINRPSRVGIKESLFVGTDIFINFAYQHPVFQRERTIRCPCYVCRSLRLVSLIQVKVHLYKKEFKLDYWYETEYGEVALVGEGDSSSSWIGHHSENVEVIDGVTTKNFSLLNRALCFIMLKFCLLEKLYLNLVSQCLVLKSSKICMKI